MRFISFIFCLLLIFSCGIKPKVKDGTHAYQLMKYNLAITMLRDELESVTRSDDKAGKMFLVGECYRQLMNYGQALDWYNQAERNNFGAKASLQKAYVLKNLMRYEEASRQFESLKNISAIAQEVNQQSMICRSLDLQKKSSKDINISIEELDVESYASDYAPAIYDQDFLVFTSDRDEATGKNIYNWTGRKHSDFFIYDKISKDLQRFDAVINTPHNEGAAAFTNDFTTCIFTRCYSTVDGQDEHCKLMVTYRVDGLWTEPTVLPFVNDTLNYSQPAFFENDSVLIFSARSNKMSHGFDLWYCEINGKNFSTPELLPNTINSTSNENFPTTDGDTLYFSSDQPSGFGGLDLYKTWVNQEGEWAKPIHLNYPINSGADDLSYILDRFALANRNTISQGFFTSSRGGDGRDKIYQFKYLKNLNQDSIQTNTGQKPNAEKVEIYLVLKVLEKNQNLGKRKLPIAKANIIFTKLEDKDFGATDKNGLILKNLEKESIYTVFIEKDSFLSEKIEISTKDLNYKDGENTVTLNREVYLDKLEKGKEFVLENIYYEYDKWDIKDDAKPSLNRLVEILNLNPKINIELGSHTDCRGIDEYNQVLSQKRAQSAIDYLISKGISSSRLNAKGYGESVPAISCECDKCTEEEHQLNRRTSFKVL